MIADKDEYLKWVADHFADLVPDEVVAGYIALFAASGIPKEQAAEFLGDTILVDELVKWGMAQIVPHTTTSPPSVRAVSPEMALLGVLGIYHAKLVRQHKLVFDGYHRLADAQAFPMMTASVVPDHLVQVLTDPDEIAMRSRDLVNSARREYMMLETPDTEMPITPDIPVIPSVEQSGHLRLRAIYDMRFTEIPNGSELIEACVRLGEVARVLPDVPMKMKLADLIAVLMPLTYTGTKGALYITAAPIVRAARQLFELLWLQATPYGTVPGSPLDEIEQRIFQLLAQGLDDKTIGGKLTTPVCDKTVQRHVKDVARRLGVSTTSRFELGWAIANHGWLTGDAQIPQPRMDADA